MPLLSQPDARFCVLNDTDSRGVSAHTRYKPEHLPRSSRFTEDNVHLTTKYLSFLFLTAALTASAAPKAAAQEVVVTTGDHSRYYDRNHRDYHVWNDREDRSYRVYLGERHRDYREFHLNNQREQSRYWSWRHSHPDRD
jgi:hypothetical protein